MRVFSAALLTLAGQLLLGTVFYTIVAWLIERSGGRRRWLVTWAASARILRRAAPVSAILALVGAGLTSGGIAGAWAGVWARPVWLVVLGAVPTGAAYAMVRAGSLEARGLLRGAHRAARLAGQLVFLGSFAQLALVFTGLLFDVPLRRALVVEPSGAGPVLLVAMLSLGGGAFIALIGGLAAKPRPACYVAAVLYATGITTLIKSYQMTL
ncbi:MAG: hypothetical protein ACYS0D_09070 [Planctomycetota bacterium]|jgi:hypothetical protein